MTTASIRVYAAAQHAAELLAQGLSKREAARRAGVSRDTLERFLRGEVVDARFVKRRNGDRRITIFRLGATPVRCRICGRRVAPPCLACQLEARMTDKRS